MSDTSRSVDLRPLALNDITRVLGWRNLPEVAAYMYTDHTITEAEHARWFAAAMTDPAKSYWIIELDGEPVGLANLYDISEPHRRASLALYVAVVGARASGIGSATDRFLIHHAFVELGLAKLGVEVLATNEPGIRVHERNGFRHDGVLRSHVVKAGRRVDVVTMSLLRDEWRQGPSAPPSGSPDAEPVSS
jgi:UDP-4-amino-4,6-dideoxy-N-acetyl-beta-L-altrosamine N-acetyltransferase